MTTKEVKQKLQTQLDQEQQDLNLITNKINSLEPDIKDKSYIKLLSRAYNHHKNIQEIKTQVTMINHNNRLSKRMFVGVSSQVKLVSTKIGAIIWVDAKNYADLLGKRIGDVVLMHNSTFMVAGIY